MGGPGSGRKKGSGGKAPYGVKAKAKAAKEFSGTKSKKAFRKEYTGGKAPKGSRKLSDKETRAMERKLSSIRRTGAG